MREFPLFYPPGVVAVVTEVIGELAFERGLQQPPGQLLQQTTLAGQLQPTRTGPRRESVDQLLVDRVQPGQLLIVLGPRPRPSCPSSMPSP